MDRLRVPFFVGALLSMAIAVLLEVGSPLFVKQADISTAKLFETFQQQADNPDTDPEDEVDRCNSPPNECEQFQEFKELGEDEEPPGLGIPNMAFLDGLLLYTVGLMGLALLVAERVQAKIQGVMTLVVSILVIVGAFVMGIMAFVKLVLMVTLLTTPPFGTLAYFAVYAFFDRGGATAALSVLMLLKIAFCILLLIAHQRFLQNKGLVLLVLTSLIANIIVSFLHGLVPLFLVSITDAIAAIVMAIVAIIWAVVFLIGSIIAIVKVLRVDRMLKHSSG